LTIPQNNLRLTELNTNLFLFITISGDEMINYIIGDATLPITKIERQGGPNSPLTKDPRIIAHICNDIGAWGKGFVLALSARGIKPEAKYRDWHIKGGLTTFELGNVQFVYLKEKLWVANMIAQRHIKPIDGIPPIRYQALEMCLLQVARFAKARKASVHMPRIGCGLAGGSWDKIEPIIQWTLVADGIEVYVYDLPK